jgi:copper resistance protein C
MRLSPGRTAGAVLVTALAVAGLVAMAGPASAHDVLVRTDPADGSTVDRVPDRVVLTFDRPALALGTALSIVGPAGDVTSGPPVLVNATVSQPVRAGSPAGAYVVRWRVTSADGHPVSGSFRFTALASGGSGTQAPTGTPSDSGPSVLWWAATALLAAAIAAALVATVRRRRGRDRRREGSGGDHG